MSTWLDHGWPDILLIIISGCACWVFPDEKSPDDMSICISGLGKADALHHIGGHHLIHWVPEQNNRWRKEEFALFPASLLSWDSSPHLLPSDRLTPSAPCVLRPSDSHWTVPLAPLVPSLQMADCMSHFLIISLYLSLFIYMCIYIYTHTHTYMYIYICMYF